MRGNLRCLWFFMILLQKLELNHKSFVKWKSNKIITATTTCNIKLWFDYTGKFTNNIMYEQQHKIKIKKSKEQNSLIPKHIKYLCWLTCLLLGEFLCHIPCMCTLK